MELHLVFCSTPPEAESHFTVNGRAREIIVTIHVLIYCTAIYRNKHVARLYIYSFFIRIASFGYIAHFVGVIIIENNSCFHGTVLETDGFVISKSAKALV